MKIVELILGDDEDLAGIEAISIVENPAIEEDFVALKNEQIIQLAEVDKEKKILLGALLIPNKPIFRKSGDEEYYIYFSRDTVRKASQIYLQKGNQNNSTLEHKHTLKGLSLVESWIVEDPKKDKIALYGLDYPVGTWVGAVKVNNDQVWDEYVKTGKVKGFSIEGYFADKADRPKDQTINDLAEIEEEEAQELLSQVKGIIRNDKRYKKGNRLIFESFSDYPDAVKNNAKRGIDLNKKVNNRCATDVGKIRAQQLAQGKPISEQTVSRMYSFLSRAEEYYKPEDKEACGTISYLLWGGLAGKRYAERKLKELGKLELYSEKVNDDFAIINDRLGYATKEMAEKIAKDIGCEGIHTHDYMNQIWYMPCKQHELAELYSEKINDDFAIINDRLGYSTREMAEKIAKDIGCDGIHTHEFENQTWYMPCEKHALTEEQFRKYKCPKGYYKDYQKHKCVKKKDNYAEIGERGGIRRSPKAPKSGTPNPNPKGQGTAKGDASTSRGAKVSKKDEAALQKKSDDFNERYKKKLGYGVTIGQLKAVFQRGLGAFNVSHSPRIQSPTAWAQARVNAYLYLVRNGRPQNPKYTGDYDLLPKGHPKSNK
tara:strand:- start:356 stop:2152 length:1797 start_codon:yes stop_codon:yes gene_type:complete